jgi:glycosyltransferase involved in cell wall biosynthesis
MKQSRENQGNQRKSTYDLQAVAVSMRSTLKVYACIHETLGHAILRVHRALVKYAPAMVEFVDSPRKAHLQIIECIGAGSLTKIWHKRYVLVQHCLLSADITSLPVWRGVFNSAILVVSYIDIPHILHDKSLPFLLTPWGVDVGIFRNVNQPRPNMILTVGWSSEQEAIEECYLAARRCGGEVLHLGKQFCYGDGFTALANLTDSELCSLYNRCKFVSGLRFTEGFEIPILEGLACGCRPICFDLPVYRNWFQDLPSYVQHCHGRRLVAQLEAVLRQGPRPVSGSEIELVRDRFNWRMISINIWNHILSHA